MVLILVIGHWLSGMPKVSRLCNTPCVLVLTFFVSEGCNANF